MRYVRNRTDTATFVYRDKCDPQYDTGHWLIRDDEVVPLMEVLKRLPAAADSAIHKADPRVVGDRSEATVVLASDAPPGDVGNFGHEQIMVRVDDRSANVDVGIAYLITELWENGIDTDNSCQGGVTAAGTIHRPYLSGHGPLDLIKLIEILYYHGFSILHLDTAWTFGGWRAVLIRTDDDG
jgi:hypothetical protein